MSNKDKPVQALPLTSMQKVTGIVENIRKRGAKDLNVSTYKAYKEWAEIEKNGLHLPPEEIISFAQQLVYRMLMCPECVSAGKCVACSCAMPQSMCAQQYKCKQDRFQEMMSPEEWYEFFQKHFEFSVIPKQS